MIIYEKDRLHRMAMTEQTETWFRRKLINAEEYVQIRALYIGGYTESKLLPRIGHFIFASVAFWSVLGVLLLYIAPGGTKACSVVVILYGAGQYAVAGIYLKANQLYRSGITHAMLLVAILCIFPGLAFLTGEEQIDRVRWIICLLASIGLAYTSIRYISSFFALLGWMCFVSFVVFLLFRMGDIGKAIAPFLIMALSAGLYGFMKKKKAEKQWMLWSRLLDVLEAASVFTFYLSGNYYVVRQMSGYDIYASGKSEIPLAWFFYGFTVLLPVLYLVGGLRSKKRLLLQAGMICSVLSVASIRYYHSFMPADIALTGVGIVLIAFSWWAIRFLHEAKAGVTSQADPDEQESDDEKRTLKGLNQLIISRAAAGPHSFRQNDAPANDVTFGGGSGGGGGAGSDF